MLDLKTLSSKLIQNVVRDQEDIFSRKIRGYIATVIFKHFLKYTLRFAYNWIEFEQFKFLKRNTKETIFIFNFIKT